MSKPRLVLDLQVGASSGWNIYGLQLAKLALGRCEVGLVLPPKLAELDDDDAAVIATLPVYAAGDVPPDAITITGLGNAGQNQRQGWAVDAPRRRLNVGVIFSEDTHWSPADVARLNTYDLIVAGSHWNADVLTRNGARNVAIVHQGVDVARFVPRETPRPPGPFRVFSGGKLEYRKGQDIVVAAFRTFLASAPNAVLVHAWHNHWPSTMATISTAGLTTGAPATNADIGAWLARNGVPFANQEDVGMIPWYRMPDVLRRCDVAVFPNRAEGGTNLVAMEALACGVPTAVSTCTGHLDLPLLLRGSPDGEPIVGPIGGYTGTDGWRETNVAATAALLADAHVGSVPFGAPDMTDWSWDRSVNRLLDACGVPA